MVFLLLLGRVCIVKFVKATEYAALYFNILGSSNTYLVTPLAINCIVFVYLHLSEPFSYNEGRKVKSKF